MKTVSKLWIGIGILALLTPLGLIIPALFGAGGAWGEWSLQEVRKLLGYVPEGMERISRLWRPPLGDYALPGQASGGGHHGFGYFLSAVIGVSITAGLAYLLAKLLQKKGK